MNKIENLLSIIIITCIVLMFFKACDDSILQPQPKSFFSAENTLVDRAGFEAVLLSSRQALAQHYGNRNLMMSEYYNTDIAVAGGPSGNYLKDFPSQLTPTGDGYADVHNGSGVSGISGGYWGYAYQAISFANVIISNLENENVSWQNESEKNEVKASALFHRSYWYYRLVNQFGDVPLVLEEVKEAKLDFHSFEREAILTQIRNDLEFAVEWLPQNAPAGVENRAAGYHLLTKVYLQLRQFDNAVESASEIIDGGQYALMTQRFGNGRYSDDPSFNVLWDLFEKENKSHSSNTECILAVQDHWGLDGNPGPTESMRNYQPCWWWGPVRDPNGAVGSTDGPSGNPQSDSLGRGIANMRTVNFFNYELYYDPNDLRVSDVNWFFKDEFIYNNPESEYYGEPYVAEQLGVDSIRTWFPFPYNKVYVPDETTEHQKSGGHSDWYLYRLAETYLLRAEAYFWLGDLSNAAMDINAVRDRAEASPVSIGDVTIDYIFDERARELYLEEMRKTEMTRVSYIMAQLGINGYNIENMYQNNWWYDRVMEKNNFVRDEVFYTTNYYRIDTYHVYWPIPQAQIDANQLGRINQNYGYPGAENNVSPLGLSDL